MLQLASCLRLPLAVALAIATISLQDVNEVRAETDSYTIEISEEVDGETFLIMRVAAAEFEKQYPEWDLRDFNLTVFHKPNEISVLVQHRDAPKNERGSNEQTPSYSVVLTADGSRVLGIRMAR